MGKPTGAAYVITQAHLARKKQVRLRIVNMAMLPGATYGVRAIPIKIPTMFLAEIEKSTVKFMWNLKGP